MKRSIVLLALTLVGCTEPIKRVSSGNEKFKVELMAVVEGCNVYRGDEGTVYFVICPDRTAETRVSWYDPSTKTYRYRDTMTVPGPTQR